MASSELIINRAGIRLSLGTKVRECSGLHRVGNIINFRYSNERGQQVVVEWEEERKDSIRRTAVSINRIHRNRNVKDGFYVVDDSHQSTDR